MHFRFAILALLLALSACSGQRRVASEEYDDVYSAGERYEQPTEAASADDRETEYMEDGEEMEDNGEEYYESHREAREDEREARREYKRQRRANGGNGWDNAVWIVGGIIEIAIDFFVLWLIYR